MMISGNRVGESSSYGRRNVAQLRKRKVETTRNVNRGDSHFHFKLIAAILADNF